MDFQKNRNMTYSKSIEKLCEIICKRVVFPWKTWEPTFKLTRDYQVQLNAIEFLNSLFDKTVMNRVHKNIDAIKKDVKQNIEDPEAETHDNKMFVDLLFAAAKNDEKMTLKDIKDEVNTFMFAVSFCNIFASRRGKRV